MKVFLMMILLSVTQLFAAAPLDPTGTTPVVNPGPAKSFFGGGNQQIMFIMIGLLVVWYFLLILPQQRKEKKRKEMLGGMKKGDKVVTIGGMFGIIERIEDEVITLRVGSNTLEFMKSAISRVVSGPNAEKNPEPPKV